MNDTIDFLYEVTNQSKELFQKNQVILSLHGFLEKVKDKPSLLLRNSSDFITDTFNHFGTYKIDSEINRFKLFDIGTDRNIPIVGSEKVQNDIYKQILSFVRQGFPNKLILLHGPNGSAKTSIIESMANAMNHYSHTDDGAVYKFNWIFPTDKSSTPKSHGETSAIGFAKEYDDIKKATDSYAFLPEPKIACKISSEFKENPIFLLPMPLREIWLRKWIAAEKNISEDDVIIPEHILLSGLSKKNQQIFENLLSAYDGDLTQVFKHVQIERFYYSRQYRRGIGTIEPQMSIDAYEKQLTMDRNLENLPRILQNIVFSEALGPIVDANRGLLEFSDLLKRPLETYKYLLSSVEKSSINLPSSTALLDIVFVGTSNEKHLDAFKGQPDFASFKSRFELVTVPYQLRASDEIKIYEKDIRILSQTKKITPHAVELLSLWAVLTRLKQPSSEYYLSKYRSLISRIDPMVKVDLYEKRIPYGNFTEQDLAHLKEVYNDLKEEHENIVVFEGRFGASPRELKTILFRAAQNTKSSSLTPMAIFEELDLLVKDRTVYDFLQIEPRGKYHDVLYFNRIIKDEFYHLFEEDLHSSMILVEDTQYISLLDKYIDNVVAFVKKEKIFSKITNSYESPSENIMNQVEKIVKIANTPERFRESLLGRIAAAKLNNPDKKIVITEVFSDLMNSIKSHYFQKKKDIIEKVQKAMVDNISSNKAYTEEVQNIAELAFNQMEKKGYTREATIDCLKYYLGHKKSISTP